jgi:hypothetical protein
VSNRHEQRVDTWHGARKPLLGHLSSTIRPGSTSRRELWRGKPRPSLPTYLRALLAPLALLAALLAPLAPLAQLA